MNMDSGRSKNPGINMDINNSFDNLDKVKFEHEKSKEGLGIEISQKKETKSEEKAQLNELSLQDRMEKIKTAIQNNDEKISALDQAILLARESSGLGTLEEELDRLRKGDVKQSQDELEHFSKKLDNIEWLTLNPIKHIQRFLVKRQYAKPYAKAIEKRNKIHDQFYKQAERVSEMGYKVTGALRKEREVIAMINISLHNELTEIKKKLKPEPQLKEENITAWAKRRALEYLSRGELKEAIDSMVADLSQDEQRPEGQKRFTGAMAMALRNDPDLTEQKVKDFIKGFVE